MSLHSIFMEMRFHELIAAEIIFVWWYLTKFALMVPKVTPNNFISTISSPKFCLNI